MKPAPYRPFTVVGLEIEYAVVDAELQPAAVVEGLLRSLAGRPTSDVNFGRIGFSNELAAHVFELKNVEPEKSLAVGAKALHGGVLRAAAVLAAEFGAHLLPTGMHPFMRPEQGRLWTRSGGRIYRAYEQVFGIGGHGWLNVQSCHVNLPFGSEEETVALHDAATCLLPYLPAIAASSPLVEGRFGPHVDNRLSYYRTNQSRIPCVSGDVVPEWMGSTRGYVRDVLRPIYRELSRVRGGDLLRHEWVNSRGVIPRFMRSALEIRVLDAQECVTSDSAIAVFVRAAVRLLAQELQAGTLERPPHAELVADYSACVTSGRAARVRASHLGSATRGQQRTARHVLEELLARAAPLAPAAERPLLRIVADRLERGNLSERITQAVGPARGGRPRADSVRSVYLDLAERLVQDEPWVG